MTDHRRDSRRGALVIRLLFAAAISVAVFWLLVLLLEGGDDKPGDRSPETRDGAAATVEGDGFTATLPGPPERSTDRIDTPNGPVKITFYVLDRERLAYALSVAELPEGAVANLDEALRGVAAEVDGTVAEREKFAYQGSPALDARITDARTGGAEATVFARMIDLDGRLLQLQVVVQGPDVKTPPPDYETFLNSLEIE